MSDIQRNMSVEFRPRRLSDLVGQEKLVAEMRAGMSERIPCAILLAGESGAGKSTIAKILRVSVNCTHGVFGDPCEKCLSDDDDNMFNFIEQNCANLGTVEDMRKLLPGLSSYPSYGRLRVILLDEAHGLGPKAQEALLLPAERGDEPNLFILCSTDPTKIKTTIKRRCSIFMVPNLDNVSIEELVKATIIKAKGSMVKEPGPLVAELIKFGISAPGFIVAATEKYIYGAAPTSAVSATTGSNLEMGSLIGAVTHGDWANCQKLLGNASPSDSDDIKRVISAVFRKILLNPSNSGKRLTIAADCIHELSANNASTIYEAGFQLSILTASVYKICQIIKAASTQTK